MNHQTNRNTKHFTSIKFILITILLALNFPIQAAEEIEGFDHFTTGFPLLGRHEFLDCSSCHIGGQFKGTPLVCELCHDCLLYTSDAADDAMNV